MDYKEKNNMDESTKKYIKEKFPNLIKKGKHLFNMSDKDPGIEDFYSQIDFEIRDFYKWIKEDDKKSCFKLETGMKVYCKAYGDGIVKEQVEVTGVFRVWFPTVEKWYNYKPNGTYAYNPNIEAMRLVEV